MDTKYNKLIIKTKSHPHPCPWSPSAPPEAGEPLPSRERDSKVSPPLRGGDKGRVLDYDLYLLLSRKINIL